MIPAFFERLLPLRCFLRHVWRSSLLMLMLGVASRASGLKPKMDGGVICCFLIYTGICLKRIAVGSLRVLGVVGQHPLILGHLH